MSDVGDRDGHNHRAAIKDRVIRISDMMNQG